MNRKGILWAVLSAFVWAAQSYTPVREIVIDGGAKDMVLRNDRLIIGTDRGTMQVYDIAQSKFIKRVSIPNITDFMGDEISARVASVDYLEGRYLLLSDSGKGGYADLRIHENNTTKQILSSVDKKPVIKARFIDREHVLLGYLSNEVSLMDLRTKKESYLIQLSESKFSDFALNADRSLAAFSCESGEITVLETRTGKILKRLNDQNVDNVYKVDIKKDYVVGAGQDRRASWYNWKTGQGGFFQASFLVYAAGLSPDARLAAYAMDEQNKIFVYNLSTRSKIAVLKGQKSTLNAIVFKDDKTLFSASDDDTVMMWRIK
jgi:WD40 repeat protein